jgi:hypothetical protein
MIQILRAENGNGVGIFHGGFAYNPCRDIGYRHRNFPNPHNDGCDLYRDSKDWYCAYKSIDQIQQWIMPHEFKKMPIAGYRVYLLTVMEYQEGEYQVIFTKESIIDRKDVTELFV